MQSKLSRALMNTTVLLSAIVMVSLLLYKISSAFGHNPVAMGLSMTVGYFGLMSLLRHLADNEFSQSTKTYD